jgi:hypothetical protein
VFKDGLDMGTSMSDDTRAIKSGLALLFRDGDHELLFSGTANVPFATL